MLYIYVYIYIVTNYLEVYRTLNTYVVRAVVRIFIALLRFSVDSTSGEPQLDCLVSFNNDTHGLKSGRQVAVRRYI